MKPVRHIAPAPTRKKNEQHRGTRQERGYDKHWYAFRKWYLARHPICVDCQNAAATQVHEIDKKRGKERNEDRCMALCGSCHAIRSARGE